jgi:hypothetical protein
VFPTLRDSEQDNGFQVADIQMFGTITTPAPTPGDYNGDSVVDAADYTVWRDGNSPDDTVGGYNLWVANYGKDYSFSLSQSIPEPTSSVLVLGLLSLLGFGKQRR